MAASNLSKCAEKSAFVIGYTGGVGKELVRELLEKRIFKKVVLIGRRQIDDPLYANTEQKVVDFEHLENHKDAFEGVEYGFCCLGTTTKIAGSDAGFIKVDHDYVVNSAKFAHENGCKRFSLVTAQNANKNSSFLYPKTKGLTEEHVSEIPFEKITIARPGFLISPTGRVMFILKPIIWLKPTFMSVPTLKVSKSMIYSLCNNLSDQKTDIITNQKLHEFSDNFYDKMFPPNKNY